MTLPFSMSLDKMDKQTTGFACQDNFKYYPKEQISNLIQDKDFKASASQSTTNNSPVRIDPDRAAVDD